MLLTVAFEIRDNMVWIESFVCLLKWFYLLQFALSTSFISSASFWENGYFCRANVWKFVTLYKAIMICHEIGFFTGWFLCLFILFYFYICYRYQLFSGHKRWALLSHSDFFPTRVGDWILNHLINVFNFTDISNFFCFKFL